MVNSAIMIIFLLLFLAGVVLLQIFLSKKQNKWLGLILPAICMLISIFAVMSIAVYNTVQETGQTVNTQGEVVKEVVRNTVNKNSLNLWSVIYTSIYVFVLCNIPTAVLLAIYAACREKIKKNRELEKMTIKDL